MPHEVDMTKALILGLKEWWEADAHRQPLRTIVLQVGDFTCVEPALLVSTFAAQRSAVPFLRGAELEIAPIPFVAFCQACRREYRPDLGREYGCPDCGAALHDIRSGRELRIARVEWAAAANEPGTAPAKRSRRSDHVWPE